MAKRIRQPDGTYCYSGLNCRLHGKYNQGQDLQTRVNKILESLGNINFPEVFIHNFSDIDEPRSAMFSSLEELRRDSKKYGERLTIAEQNAISLYSYIDYEEINRFHWHGKKLITEIPEEIKSHIERRYFSELKGLVQLDTKDDEILDEVISEWTKHLDSAIAKGATEKPRLLYRGLTENNANHVNVAGLRIGDEIEFKGYTSASYSPVVATDFAKEGRVVLEFSTRHSANISYATAHEWEQEALLPREAKFRVKRILVPNVYKTVASSIDSEKFPNLSQEAFLTVIQLEEIES